MDHSIQNWCIHRIVHYGLSRNPWRMNVIFQKFRSWVQKGIPWQILSEFLKEFLVMLTISELVFFQIFFELGSKSLIWYGTFFISIFMRLHDQNRILENLMISQNQFSFKKCSKWAFINFSFVKKYSSNELFLFLMCSL